MLNKTYLTGDCIYCGLPFEDDGQTFNVMFIANESVWCHSNCGKLPKVEVEPLTENDYNMMAYFHGELGCIYRWSSWADRKPIIAQHHPDLIAAFDLVATANRQLDELLDGIVTQATMEFNNA